MILSKYELKYYVFNYLRIFWNKLKVLKQDFWSNVALQQLKNYQYMGTDMVLLSWKPKLKSNRQMCAKLIIERQLNKELDKTIAAISERLFVLNYFYI